MKKTLHIGDNDSWEGCMKLTMYNIAPRGVMISLVLIIHSVQHVCLRIYRDKK